MTPPISLVVDDNPPIAYVARITTVYCCNCRETCQVTECFTLHPITNGTHMRPIKHDSNVQYYNLPIKKIRDNPIPVPFCHNCATDSTFANKPKAPPRKVQSAAPSWVGANKPSDYTIAGTKKEPKPKAKAPKTPKTYTLDDLD